MSENTIIDLPTGVVTFYMDTNEPRTPGINKYNKHDLPSIVVKFQIGLYWLCNTHLNITGWVV